LNPQLIDLLPAKFKGSDLLEEYLESSEEILDIVLKKLTNLPRLLNPNSIGLTEEQADSLDLEDYDTDALPISNVLKLSKLINYAPWYWYDYWSDDQLRVNIRQAVYWYSMICRNACYEIISKLAGVETEVEELWTWDYEHFFHVDDDWVEPSVMFERGDFDEYNVLYPPEGGGLWTVAPYKSPHFNLILYLDEEVSVGEYRRGEISEIPDGVGRLQDDATWWTAYEASTEDIRPAHTVLHHYANIFGVAVENTSSYGYMVVGAQMMVNYHFELGAIATFDAVEDAAMNADSDFVISTEQAYPDAGTHSGKLSQDSQNAVTEIGYEWKDTDLDVVDSGQAYYIHSYIYVDPNILLNPSFEDWTGPVVDNWTHVDSNSTDEFGDVHDGSISILVQATTAGGYIYQSFPTVIGEDYTVTVWMKKGISAIRALVLHGMNIDDDTGYVAPADWTEYTLTFTAADTSELLFLRVEDNGGTGYFDDTSVIRSISILNFDFEDWTLGDPDDWDLAEATATEETVDVYSGSSSLKLTPTISGGGVTQTLSTNIGDTYRIKIMMKEGTSSVRASLYHGAEVLDTTDYVDPSDWTEYTLTFTAKYTTASLFLQVEDSGGTGYFDYIVGRRNIGIYVEGKGAAGAEYGSAAITTTEEWSETHGYIDSVVDGFYYRLRANLQKQEKVYIDNIVVYPVDRYYAWEPYCLTYSKVCSVLTRNWLSTSNPMDTGYYMDDGYYMDTGFVGVFNDLSYFKISNVNHGDEYEDPTYGLYMYPTYDWSDIDDDVYTGDITATFEDDEKYTIIADVPESEVHSDLVEIGFFTSDDELVAVMVHPYYTKRANHTLRYELQIYKAS